MIGYSPAFRWSASLIGKADVNNVTPPSQFDDSLSAREDGFFVRELPLVVLASIVAKRTPRTPPPAT
jgi:hypothetical protein